MIMHHHHRYHRLFQATVKRLPKGIWPIKSLDGMVRVRHRAQDGLTAGVVYYNSGGDRFRTTKNNTALKQRVTFYSSLLDSLSDEAVVAIMAHEVAHAWLNEVRGPEQSAHRERMVDSLVLKWGFGPEVAVLDKEADTVN